MFRLPTAGEWTRRPRAWVLKATGGVLPLSCTSPTASFPVWPVWGLFSFLKLLPLPDTIQDVEDSEWDPRGKKDQGPGDKITGQGNSLEVTEKAQRRWSPRGPGNPVLGLGTGSGGLALPLDSRSWSASIVSPGGLQSVTQGHRGGADRGPPVICASWDPPVPGLPLSLRAWATCPLTTSPAPGAAFAFCIHPSRSRKQNPPGEENFQVKQCLSSSWGLTEIQSQASPLWRPCPEVARPQHPEVARPQRPVSLRTGPGGSTWPKASSLGHLRPGRSASLCVSTESPRGSPPHSPLPCHDSR